MDLEPEAIEDPCQTNPGKQVTGATKARNDLKWESFREDVQEIYLNDDQSLATTQQVIAEKYDFKARYVLIFSSWLQSREYRR